MTYVMLTWLADALNAEGCKVREHPGWRTRGRPSSTGQFNPYGVLWHHTGSTASNTNPAPTLKMCISGRSDLPGPLCQVVIGYDGTCHVIAAGRANHAGKCNGFGPFAAGDANSQLVGFEIDYNGTQPMSPAQKDAATRASAACLKRFRRNHAYAARHAETSVTGKWDTGGVSGPQLRALIQNYMNPKKEDVDMPLTDAEKKWLTKMVAEETNRAVARHVGDVVKVPKSDPAYDDKNEKVRVSTALNMILAKLESGKDSGQ